jgi:hypothetical protein
VLDPPMKEEKGCLIRKHTPINEPVDAVAHLVVVDPCCGRQDEIAHKYHSDKNQRTSSTHDPSQVA